MNHFQSLLLGAFLATVGGFLSQEYAAQRDRQRRRNLLRIFLRHLVLQMNGIFGRFVETYQRTNIASVLYLAELQNTRMGYDRNSDWIILFDEQLRQRIFDYFNREQLARVYIDLMIRLAGQPNFAHEYTNQQIAVKMQDIANLQALGEDILRRLGE